MMNYEKIVNYINEENWKLAKQELQMHDEKWNEELAILRATVCFHEKEFEAGYEAIQKGLLCNRCNYELYLLLGNYYERFNVNQAWLCYENAEFYCKQKEDLKVILEYKKNIEQQEDFCVRPVSIIIVAESGLDAVKLCVDSIRLNNLASAYEIVVVDNDSTDGTREWLQGQKDIKLVPGKKGQSLGNSYNKGIRHACQENDVLLLEDTTMVLANSIYELRMGVYSGKKTGAAGSIANYAGNEQYADQQLDSPEEYMEFAEKNNLPSDNPYELKAYLMDFALLLKRDALDITGYFDSQFMDSLYLSGDLGLRMQSAGWTMLLCRNSFVFRCMVSGTSKTDGREGAKNFRNKWGFDIAYYRARAEIIQLVTKKKDEPFTILEVGCGLGTTLTKIKYLCPMADIKGIEIDQNIAKIVSNYMEVICGNAETMELPYGQKSLDYIVLGDVLEHLFEPQKLLKRLIPYLKPDGAFICSIPNLMHKSVIAQLLQGKFEYKDSGILDQTHVKFFTLDSIYRMFGECGLELGEIFATAGMVTKAEDAMVKDVLKIPGTAPESMFDAFQYVFTAKVKR